ncbi:enoyl-CoA hydratase [Rhodococcus sp. D-46]|uniref:enoyl-CoA hydratase-related protein n=1 Tax=unclassified Rhodococcus (in: high G+C Gram-positive bacteria) TaxID=192944 RepID=UPI0007180E65|nr:MULTISPECIES: enoyl-CoA hydratase-related protein [unclassified Rhodococcus (in: high G+C Gram-positive bacteria)]NHE64820.1 enoyl-CoA hydratase [Rhodococcus sp. D-46]
MPDLVDLHRDGQTLVITMRREARRNAIDADMTAGLDAAFNLLDDDPELRVGVLAGAGAVFSAGTDLKAGSGATERGGEYGLIRRRRAKPLIAAVDAPAYGGGFELVLACDLVVASSRATFSLPEVQRGVIATCGALFRSARALPRNVAAELLLTGDPLTADRAHVLGLVNVLTEPGEAIDAAIALAGRISSNAPVSVSETLHAMAAVDAPGDELGWQVTARAFAAVLESEDIHEGLLAFAEKRSPRWSGR